VLVVLPPMVVVVFGLSERGTRRWLGVGLDTDLELLEMITRHEIAQTRIGRHLELLRRMFPGPVLADMLCLLRVHLELACSRQGDAAGPAGRVQA